MAVFRARALAVAAGVPASFALLAGLLTVASPMTVATAAEPVPVAIDVPVAIACRPCRPGRGR